jgi:predicted alpha/beta hydrolase
VTGGDVGAAGGERLVLTAADGYALAATRYAARPEARQRAPHAHLLLAGATGVPQGFYRRFAEHAAGRGFETLTLDYRGIGRSAPPSLRGFRMDYRDWARLDLAAAVEVVRAAAARDGVPLYLVGHSFGGHAVGLLPDPAPVTAAYVFATGAGWHGWMTPAERVKVLAMWHAVGPRWSRGRGTSLEPARDGRGPAGRRVPPVAPLVRVPRYFFDDPEVRDEVAASFARVRVPIAAANATDDPWAPPRSRDAFMRGYQNAPWERVDIDPVASGVGPVGHMGYFRPAAACLWDAALDWLAARGASAGAGSPAPTHRLYRPVPAVTDRTS